ncbi:MAG TPA: nickel-dependent hydrogenase large subunit [Novimethylophilus sp.]|uniref:nickel-dependent hydrogenase large subunit n=1 Tax=Novimethylophilus sp. TaxID=2137426 RepID=UPI002F402DA4
MADTGKLSLRIHWDVKAVGKVEIASSRPQAFQLLRARAPEHAVQMAPLLFSLCGKAQGAAAAAAVAAAQGRALPDAAGLERSIACEALQEHLWRLLLDWPILFGLPRMQTEFVRWHGMLREIAAGRGEMRALRSELEHGWLGMSGDGWRTLDSCRALQSWWHESDSPAAHLLAAIDEAGDGVQAVCTPLLPAWGANDALLACAGSWTPDFAARPAWAGRPAETGALAWHAAKPPLRDMLHRRPSRILARVLARAYDVLELADATAAPRLDRASAEKGAGLAVVRTARGLLMHHVRIAAGLVEDYCVVAPTEWNFHPRGALAEGLNGMTENDEARLVKLAGIHALSLDPCVEYGMEVCHA